jgi:acid stress-induced BolA-like protein IbaG/YrbA
MDNLIEKIKNKISNHLNCTHLSVEGDGRHFEAVVVSENFQGKSRVERHKFIYDALGDSMAQEIHALSMKTYTREEWKNLK